jgi:galactose oxidase-like protein
VSPGARKKGHGEGPERPRPYRAPKEVTLTLKAPLVRETGERALETIVAVFDDNDVLLDLAPVKRGAAQVTVPGALVGQPVHVLHAPVDERVETPTLARLRRNLALEQRVLVRPDLRLDLPPAIVKHWKRSCCRVRGRVVMKVRLPGGTTQERPLCNARVVICEVDTSFPTLVKRLPNDLVYRLRDEWVTALDAVGTGGAPTAGLQAARGGLQLAFKEPREAARAREPLLDLAGARAVEPIRAGLIEHANLIRPFWCDFEWLRPFYSLDCLHTVGVEEDGSFDTEIWYPCYGDHPDLYFRVEQDCHPGGWLTVHAPPVHCNTHWDYCCGTPVKIEVTHPAAAPGRAPAPCLFPYVAGDPASVGSWHSLSHTSGVFVVHSALLPTGKVLLFSGTAEAGLPEESRVWDPIADTMTSQSFGEDLFCSGHAMLPDGRVLVVGGASSPGHGIDSTHIFDGATETWTKVADMAFERWYPTALTLPNGRVAVFSGRISGPPVAQVEVYDPGPGAWTTLPAGANKSLEIYPSLHVMSDGKILYTGTRWAGAPGWPAPPPSELFDPGSNSWSGVDDHVIPNRTEGFSVLLPPLRPPDEHEFEGMEGPHPPTPTLSRVLVVGGGSTEANANQRSAEIIDMADAAPTWRRIADMNFPRTNANGVLLPDGTVLFCSGIDGYKWGPNSPTLTAELFDPEAESWTNMAAMSTVRQYHSISLLLPDGRVLNTGGVGGPGNIMSMEVYSPPYLHRGPRPRITANPGVIGYGANFTVSSPDQCRIDRVSVIRMSSVTHHTNTDQRYLALEFHRQGNCDLRVTAPANARLAPPGYYLLFLLDDCGVPSVGRIVCFH